MLSKRELFNAKNAGKKIEAGLQINVVATGTFEDTDKDGKPVTVCALKTSNGEIYTTISATIASSLPELDAIIDEEKAVDVRVNVNKSNNNREFFQLQLM